MRLWAFPLETTPTTKQTHHMIIKELIEELQKAAAVVGEFAEVEVQYFNSIFTVDNLTLANDGVVLLAHGKSPCHQQEPGAML